MLAIALQCLIMLKEKEWDKGYSGMGMCHEGQTQDFYKTLETILNKLPL
jgi:hypothetical protein